MERSACGGHLDHLRDRHRAVYQLQDVARQAGHRAAASGNGAVSAKTLVRPGRTDVQETVRPNHFVDALPRLELASRKAFRSKHLVLGPAGDALDVLSRFRVGFYDCLYARTDALFELTDAVLCADGPVKTLVELSLTVEHRRGHGALYAALDRGWIEPARLRRVLADLPLPKAADGRIVLAVDVSNWLRPDAPTSDDRLFCHVYGRGDRKTDQLVPGWPYSFVAALEAGRTSWVALLDAVRLGPADGSTLQLVDGVEVEVPPRWIRLRRIHSCMSSR